MVPSWRRLSAESEIRPTAKTHHAVFGASAVYMQGLTLWVLVNMMARLTLGD